MPPSKIKRKFLNLKSLKNDQDKKSPVKQEIDAISPSLSKLRYPEFCYDMLPSIKSLGSDKSRFRNIFDALSDDEVIPINDICIKTENKNVLGSKRKKCVQNQLFCKFKSEEKFSGMIFDVALTSDKAIVVSTSEGAFLCNSKFEDIMKLDPIHMAGGIDSFSDGRIAIVCRSADTINIYEKNGTFINSFDAGFSPMGLAINTQNEIIVGDTGEKCVRVYNSTGEILHLIPTHGHGYCLEWPLYLAVNYECSIFISDCISQKVLEFDNNYNFVRMFPMQTHGGNYVIYPHGILCNENNLLIIDFSINSLEVFVDSGCYLQTLIPSEQGSNIKLKVAKISKDGDTLILGGVSGIVQIFEYLSNPLEQEDNNIAYIPTKKDKKEENDTEVLIKKENIFSSIEDVIVLD